VHDAYLLDPTAAYAADRPLVIDFAQEGWDEAHPGPIGDRLDKTWRYEEWSIPFYRGQLTIENVRAIEADQGWGDGDMIVGLGCDAAGRMTLCSPGGDLHITISALSAQAVLSGEEAFRVRRRIGRFGGRLTAETGLSRSQIRRFRRAGDEMEPNSPVCAA
jgi:hypothetical protein